MTWRPFSVFVTVLLVGCAATVAHVNERAQGRWNTIHAPYSPSAHRDINGRVTA